MKKYLVCLVVIFIFSCYKASNNDTGMNYGSHQLVTTVITDLEKKDVISKDNVKGYLRFGMVCQYSARQCHHDMQPMMDYLEAETGYRFNFIPTHNYDQMLTNMFEHRVDFAMVGATTFITLKKTLNVEALVKPLDKSGKPYYESAIFTTKTSGITKLSDLKGKKFAFGSRQSTSSFIIPYKILIDAGVKLKDFSYYEHVSGKHSDMITYVLDHKFDAGASIDFVVNEFLEKGIVILAKGNVPQVPFIAHPSVSSEIKTMFKNAYLKIDPKKPEFVDIMKEWQPELRNGFTACSDSDYNEIKEAMKNLERENYSLQ